MSKRCVLAIPTPEYPVRTLAGRISGTVVVTGVFDRAGRVQDLHVDAADAKTSRGEKAAPDPIAQAVVQHVRTWRVEESTRETPFRIAFDFQVTDDLSAL